MIIKFKQLSSFSPVPGMAAAHIISRNSGGGGNNNDDDHTLEIIAIIFLFVFGVSILIAIICCWMGIGKQTLISSVPKWYEVVGYDRPKHFYVDLKDIHTGFVYHRVYVSKHCNDYRKLIIGTKWQFTEDTYTSGEKTWTEVGHVRYDFCNRISQYQFELSQSN